MLHRRIQRSLSRVCINTGFNSNDFRTKKIMEYITKKVPDVEFFGVGGQHMKTLPNFRNYGDVGLLMDKNFFPRRHQAYGPFGYDFLPLAHTNFFVKKEMNLLEKQGFWEEFDRDVAIMLVNNNEPFAWQLTKKLAKVCATFSKPKPLVMLIEKSKRWYHRHLTFYFDYFLESLPIPQKANLREAFQYPGTFFGHQGVFDAYKYILSTDARYAGCFENGMLRLNKHDLTLIIEELSFNERRKFREKHNIPDSNYAIYVWAGDAEQEHKKNWPVIIKAVKTFLEDAKQSFQPSSFTVIVHGYEVPAELASLGTQTVLVQPSLTDNSERIQAMCASDVGAICHGHSVSEAAVAQLPTVVLNCQSFGYAYMTLNYNVWVSEMNMLARGELFPETTGRNFGEKVAEFWQQWFAAPKTRYKMARRNTPWLLKMMPPGPTLPHGPMELESEELLFREPDEVLGEFLVEKIKGWEAIRTTGVSGEELSKTRRSFIYNTPIA